MEEWHLSLERDETEIEAGRRAMSLPGWTLNQTLAWIATRKPEAVGRDDGEVGLTVWMAFEEVSGRPIDFPHPRSGEAWQHLAMALAHRKLLGFATQVRMSRTNGIVRHSLGMAFPPDGQAGLALGCSVFDGDRAIVAPTDRVSAASWDEFHDLTFGREDIMRLWPPLPVVDAEFEEVGDWPQIAGPLTSEAVENETASKPSLKAPVSSGGSTSEEYGPSRPTIRAVCDAYLSFWDETGRPNALRPQERTLLPRVLALCRNASRKQFRTIWAQAREPYNADWSTAGRKTNR